LKNEGKNVGEAGKWKKDAEGRKRQREKTWTTGEMVSGDNPMYKT